MHLHLAIAAWMLPWLDDPSGINVRLLLAINQALQDQWVWLAQLFTAIGSYWGAPVLLVFLWAQCRRVQAQPGNPWATLPYRFAAGFLIAFAAAALLKGVLAFPRPAVALAGGVVRAIGQPDSRYSMPSGHATYIAVVAASLWPLLQWRGRSVVMLLVLAVCWSRVALGAHFPADVLFGLALGVVSVLAVAKPVEIALQRPYRRRSSP